MKKIILCLLSVVTMVSCSPSRYEEMEATEGKSVKVSVQGYISLLDIGKVTYDGHSYIMFSGTSSLNGIVHDPDCVCHKKNSNEIDFTY